MRRSLVVLSLLTACGDDAPPSGPQPLVPDPAVETGCAAKITDAAHVRAKVVACADELAPGWLAGGRMGDFVLENDRVRVIVRGPGQGFYLHGGSGGGIIDAVRATPSGWSEDLVKEMLPAVDLTVGAFDELVITHAGGTEPAELVVRGPAAQLELIAAAGSREVPDVIIEHHYRLAPGAAEVEMWTRVFAQPGNDATTWDLYDAMFMGGRAPAFIPGRDSVEGQVSGDFVATKGRTTSYGLVFPADGLSLIDLAGIRLVQGPSVDANPDTSRRWLVIGDGSVASVTEAAWRIRGVATQAFSVTSDPEAEVVVRDGAGKPITIGRGTSTIAVPAGSYTAQAQAVGYVTGAAVPLGDGAIPHLGASGLLDISVRDDTSSTPLPARVLVEAPGGASRILWTDATGALRVHVEPGTYRVTVSRGLEYDAYVATSVVVADEQTVPIAARLERVVDTAGWIALDTHLHSELSTDSTFPVDDRLRAVAAEGVEVPVSTDHDMITDYGPIIAELGLDAWLGNLVGAEVSSLIWGHLNGFPFVPKPDRTGRGSPSWLARSPAQVFQAMHDTGDDAIVQINHPRDGSTSLFDALDLDPSTGTAHANPATLGLPASTDLSDLSNADALEVANGSSQGDFEQVFDDWLKLTLTGTHLCATGSSDSHGAARYAGESRTYVYVGPGNDVPATVDHDAIVAAIRAQHVVVGTGAFVTATIGTALPGDTVAATGPLQLHVRVQAPPWRPLGRVRIFRGAQEVQAFPLDAQDTSVVRFDQTIDLPAPTSDTFYVVRVDMAGSGAPVNDDAMASFTNPIFVDVP